MEEPLQLPDIRARRDGVLKKEVNLESLRFQTVSIYLAAVGLIVGLSSSSRAIGALLLVISAGLWILDLRNRDLVGVLREKGRRLEETINKLAEIEEAEAVSIFNPSGEREGVKVGFFFFRVYLKSKPDAARKLSSVVAHQVGIDLIVFGVMGYAVHLIVARGGWYWLDGLIPVAFVLGIVGLLSLLDWADVQLPE